MLMNAVVSVVVFAVLVRTHDSVFPTLSVPWLSFVSGLGAMAVLRSKLFTVRTEAKEEIPIGGDAVVRALLQATDREIDRAQADERHLVANKAVRRLMGSGNLGTEQQLKDFAASLRVNLSGYQNVPQTERLQFDETVAELVSVAVAQNTPYIDRCISVALVFQQIAGTENLASATGRFGANDPIQRKPPGSATGPNPPESEGDGGGGPRPGS
jgi:hypothetical protein